MGDTQIRFKRFIFKHYWVILLLAFSAALSWFGLFSRKTRDEIDLFVTIAALLLGFFYFVQKQKLDELNIFKELFGSFNARYDRLNETLNEIVGSADDVMLKQQEIWALYDYFNLCSEEYLFYRRGYIDPETWRAWCGGMLYFFDNKRVRSLWEQEQKKQKISYYGLTFEKIEHFANKN